jgi:uncharacterized protein (TIGR02453 family)
VNDTVFTAFEPGIIDFLRELSANNERDWFQENKHRYDEKVLHPSFGFISQMAPHIKKISPHFEAVPKRIGGSLMRVYRDTRFSKDKRPYKTNVGIQFRHKRARDVHAPGFYFHIGLDEVFIAAGTWHPEPAALANIRTRIVEKTPEWRRVVRNQRFAEVYVLGGESLKRPPRGYPNDHPALEDLKRKDFISVQNFDTEALFLNDICAETANAFAAAKPLVRFLCKAQGLEF